MSRALGRPAFGAGLVSLTLALAACAGTSATQSTGGAPGRSGRPGQPPPGASAPARDTFSGSIVAGTGAYSGRKGRLKMYLHPHGSGQARTVKVVFAGQCGSLANCVSLNGTVTGTLAALARGLPDTGRDYGLSGSGQVSPLGTVRLKGVVAGTGFISHAHLLLKLTLTTSSGKVAIVALSGLVNGFTSP